MPRGISLHIGLNRVDPAHYAGWNGALSACEADANSMEALAQEGNAVRLIWKRQHALPVADGA